LVSLKAEMRLCPILSQNLPFNKRPSCWRNNVSVGGKLVVSFWPNQSFDVALGEGRFVPE
jgi:hypothetical protein